MKLKLLSYSLAFVLMSSFIITAQDIPPAPPKVYEPAVLSESLYFGKLSEEDEKDYLKNMKAELKEHLKEIKETNESRYNQLLREYYFRNKRYPMMRKIEKDMVNTEKEILEAEIFVESLASKYKKANAQDKSNIKQDLEKNVSVLFDLKEKNRENEVKELESRLDELKKKIKLRQNNRSTIIKRRMEELLGEDEYLEWE